MKHQYLEDNLDDIIQELESILNHVNGTKVKQHLYGEAKSCNKLEKIQMLSGKLIHRIDCESDLETIKACGYGA